MKQDRILIIIVAGLFILLVLGLFSQPKKIIWEKSYSLDKTDPYACRAFYELAGDIYPQQSIKKIKIPANEFYKKRTADSVEYIPSNYFLIGNANFDNYEADAILEMVKNGDNVFIASEYIPWTLTQGAGIYSQYKSNAGDTLRLNFKQPELYSSKAYSMKSSDNSYSIQVPDSVDDVEVLSVNSNGDPVFVSQEIGRGKLYIHSVPVCFTNYYMIYKENHEYVSKCLSFLPVLPVFFDVFYTNGREEPQTPIRYLLSEPALKTAYVLFIALALLYMLFQSKRRQRIIPVIKPFENSTLEFVATVASLYQNKSEHTSLTKKKLIFFTEKLRLKYQLPIQYNEETILALSARSGVDLETMRTLFKFMKYVQSNNVLNETDLIHLNKLIETFWKKAGITNTQ